MTETAYRLRRRADALARSARDLRQQSEASEGDDSTLANLSMIASDALMRIVAHLNRLADEERDPNDKGLPPYVVEKHCACSRYHLEREDGTLGPLVVDRASCPLHSTSRTHDLPEGI